MPDEFYLAGTTSWKVKCMNSFHLNKVGLVVADIRKAHRGEITVESKDGDGPELVVQLLCIRK
jgi:hypothetical protein